MNEKTIAISAVGLAISVGAATAQTTARFEIALIRHVTASNSTLTIEVRAAWDDPGRGFVFGGANLDLEADDGVFSNAKTPLTVLHGPTPMGNRIPFVSTGQLHIPPLGFFGLPDNPILILTADWTATDFTPRLVNFQSSRTNSFLVADALTGVTTQLYPHSFTHGHSMYVVPASGPAGVLGLLAIATAGRRRGRTIPKSRITLVPIEDSCTLGFGPGIGAIGRRQWTSR